mgnify:CR=1 FL=1
MDVLGLMAASHVRKLPVVANGRVVGLVSDRDVLSYARFTVGDDFELPEHFTARDAMRNDVVVYEGLRELGRRGARSCWTGDAADELFAGYSFVYQRSAREIEDATRRFAGSMHFNGPLIGDRLGLAVRSPYLDRAVIAHALTLLGIAPLEEM